MKQKISSQEGKSSDITICMLASGSKGNSIYISDGTTSVLVDAGLSGVEIERRMKSKGLSPDNLDAIIVSHEHADHIHGVGVLSRRFDVPVYLSHKTYKAALPFLGRIEEVRTFECGLNFKINDISFHPFSVSHDAEDTSGFTVAENGTKIGIATDFGIATAMVKEHLGKCSVLVLEANHDPEMLAKGPYPWPLKQRIKSRTGHLSNDETRALLQEIQHDNLEHVILAHISETNNTPEKAIGVVGHALTCCGARLDVAGQYEAGKLIRIKQK
ncbi:MAG: MBL fold metallo-hydrolase [Desulfobacteraceae bacterium]|nr:MAG: MBL fold metallo-hydrolase [Desulfobacteraceae bacterium]